MRALEGEDAAGAATLPGKATLEEAMRAMNATSADRLIVVEEGGQPIGILTSDAIIAAMVGPAEAAAAQA